MSKTIKNVSKVFALVLALVMVLGTVVPALAVTDNADKTTDTSPNEAIVNFQIRFTYGEDGGIQWGTGNAPNDKFTNVDELQSVKVEVIRDGAETGTTLVDLTAANEEIPVDGRVDFEIDFADTTTFEEGDIIKLTYQTKKNASATPEVDPIEVELVRVGGNETFYDIVNDKVVTITEAEDLYVFNETFEASDHEATYFGIKDYRGDGVENTGFGIFKVEQSQDSHGNIVYEEDKNGNPVLDGEYLGKTDASTTDGFADFSSLVNQDTEITNGSITIGKEGTEGTEPVKFGELLAVVPVDAGGDPDPDYDPQWFNIWDLTYDRLAGDDAYLNPDEITRAIRTIPLEDAKIRKFNKIENVFIAPLGDPNSITVKIFTNGDPDNASARKPVPGAEVVLYEDASTPWGEITKGKEVARGKTGATGTITFNNLPKNVVKQIITPIYDDNETGKLKEFGTTRVKEFGTTRLVGRYLIEQVDTGEVEGIEPYPYLISTEGFYEAADLGDQGNYHPSHLTAPADRKALQFTTDGNELVVEIENYGDFIYNTGGRLSGADRYATAVEIAKAQFPDELERSEDGYKNVVVAEVNTFADALTAGVIAYEYEAPLLFVGKNELPQVTADYIDDEDVERVILVGGPNTISTSVESAIKDLGPATKRISGEDRYETAVEVGEALRGLYAANKADQAFYKGYNTKSTVFLANSQSFADALTASVPAAYYGVPILLTDAKTLNPTTEKALADWDIETVIIVGGPDSVSEDVETALSTAGKGYTIERISGDNRQTTSMEIAETFFPKASRVLFADGESFADALAATPFGARIYSPVILVNGTELPINDDVKAFIDDNNIGHATVVGGTKQITTEVRDALAKLLTVDAPDVEVESK